MQGKAGCPVLCQSRLDLCQDHLPPTPPPADLAPRAAGAQGQGGGLAPWPCRTASPGGGARGHARLLLPLRPHGIWGAPGNLPPLPSTSWPHGWLRARDPRAGPCPPVPGVGAQLCPGPTRAERQTVLVAGRGRGQQHPWGAASPAGEHSPGCLLACTERARSQQGRAGTAGWDKPFVSPCSGPESTQAEGIAMPVPPPPRQITSGSQRVPLGMAGAGNRKTPLGLMPRWPGWLSPGFTSLQYGTLRMLEGATGQTGEPGWGRGVPPQRSAHPGGGLPCLVWCCHPLATCTASGAPPQPPTQGCPGPLHPPPGAGCQGGHGGVTAYALLRAGGLTTDPTLRHAGLCPPPGWGRGAGLKGGVTHPDDD